MGEYAEYQLFHDMRSGIPDSKHDGRRSPIGGHCPHCGKPVRTIAGRVKDSMAAHIKAKHGKTAATEYRATSK